MAPVGSRGNSSLRCDGTPPPTIRGEGEVPPLSQARAERPSATLSASTRSVLARNQLPAAMRCACFWKDRHQENAARESSAAWLDLCFVVPGDERSEVSNKDSAGGIATGLAERRLKMCVPRGRRASAS